MSAVLKPQTVLLPFQEWMVEQVVSLAREMHAESASHSDASLNEVKLLLQLRSPITNPDVYVKFAVRGNDVIGGFFGVITTMFFSDDRAASDRAWFVRRDRRGSMAAVTLVRDFEEWAKEKGVRKFFLGQSTGVNVDTTKALYEHLGYRVVGVNTVKEL